MKNIVIGFYVSSKKGSEYRVGYEYFRFASQNKFDLAITSDLLNNDDQLALENELGIRVVKIPSIIKNQDLLYKFNDFVAQVIWHYRVARWIKKNYGSCNVLWITPSSAQLWYPLQVHLNLSNRLILGPISGCGIPTKKMFSCFTRGVFLREWLRSLVAKYFLRLKIFTFIKNQSKLIVLAKTSEMKDLLTGLGIPTSLIPEFLTLVKPSRFKFKPKDSPIFVWAGQNIPRKNLPLAIDLFTRLKVRHFPNAILDIYGVDPPVKDVSYIRFHGWVKNVNWQRYTNGGVFLLTSFREGISTVLIEATSNGLYCIAPSIGGVSCLVSDSSYILDIKDYPSYSDACIDDIAEKVKLHLKKNIIDVKELSYEAKLKSFLMNCNVFN